MVSSIEKIIDSTSNKLKDLPCNLLMEDVLFCHGNSLSMFLKVIFGRHGNKGNMDVAMMGSL